MNINDADVAELVDARDLKCLAAFDPVRLSCKTGFSRPAETGGDPAYLQNISCIKRGGEQRSYQPQNQDHLFPNRSGRAGE